MNPPHEPAIRPRRLNRLPEPGARTGRPNVLADRLSPAVYGALPATEKKEKKEKKEKEGKPKEEGK